MKRTYESGAAKRKKKKETEENLMKQKDSLLQFFKKPEKNDGECNSPSADINQNNDVEPKILGLNEVEPGPTCSFSSELSLNEDEVEPGPTCSFSSELSLNEDEVEPGPTCSFSCELTHHRPTTEFPLDVALWPLNPTSEMIDFFIKNKPENIGDIHNLRKQFTDSNKTFSRNLNDKHFYRIKTNGEKEKRNWLVFSETCKSVYCYVCKLFPDPKQTQHVLIEGFSDWSRITKVLSIHETSKCHLTAMVSYIARSKLKSRVDYELMTQIEKEQGYWRQVFYRVVATVKLLAQLGLPFRGHRESDSCGNVNNKGNFLSCLEYLSEFDEFIKEHLKSMKRVVQVGLTIYLTKPTMRF